MEEDLEKYVKEIYNLIDGSITEYFFYKKSFLSPLYEYKIAKYDYNTAKSKYICMSKNDIIQSEEKYVQENVKNILSYLLCFRKIRTIKCYNNLINLLNKKDDPEIVDNMVVFFFFNKLKFFSELIQIF